MTHLPALIEDLGLILAAAGVVTLVFRRLRQPVVLGYIVAGFLVGPHFPFIPTISETENIRIWAEIGVIFLLFALGLEFSFKKLAREGSAASITAIVEVLGMVAVGYATGKLLGWSTMDSLFLGGILSISSTTIIIRAFEETKSKGRGFVGLVFGVLIMEDLLAILILVLFSTIAMTKGFAGFEMLSATLKLLLFLGAWVFAGIYLLPRVFRYLRRFMSDETLLVVSLGLCFGMVVLTTKAGFSPALGAFIMGSLLAETGEGGHIDKLIRPVRDLFAAIFFVSVGMLIEPKVLMDYAFPIVVITLITLIGKALCTFIGAILARRSLRHAVQAGLSMAQIGEFSFIIASLGLSTKTTSEFLYPIAVSVSAITTFTTPYLIKSGDRAWHLLESALPQRWRKRLTEYGQHRPMPVGEGGLPPLAPWDAHITSLEIRPTSPVIGKSLEQLRIRESYGISIALIERGEKKIPAPTRSEMLFPYDKVYVIGTDEQILKFKSEIDSRTDEETPDKINYTLHPFLVTKDSPYMHRTIRDSGIREKSHGLVVGLERKGARSLNPDSTTVIEAGDLLWIVGDAKSLKNL